MAHLKDSVLIDAPVEKVHGFAADISNWSTWFVGLGKPDSVQGDNSPGTVVKHSYLFMGIHSPITTKVTEHRQDADGSYHWRAENEGAIPGWHTWDYEPKDGGTMVSVEMEYEMPGSVLGKVADRLFVERSQARALHHTLENLKQLTEA